MVQSKQSKMLIHSEKLNPCRCGSTKVPDLDSDDMVPCWGVKCYDCGQFQHDDNWTATGAVNKWNKENPILECYFIPSKQTASATICANCGKEKYIHTVGEDIKVTKTIIQKK